MKDYLKSNKTVLVILILILLLGGVFRFYGLNWDQNHHLHPDERMISMVAGGLRLPDPLTLDSLLSQESPLNPKFFPYGSFPLYLLKFAGWTLQVIDPDYARYASLNLVGRGISALADLASIIVIFIIGKRVWNKKVGIVASLFYSISVFPIQAAHFYAVDTLLSFFILSTLYRLIVFYEKPSFNNALLVGGFFGLSLATKVSASVLVSAVGVALILELVLIFLKKMRQIRIAAKVHKAFFEFSKWVFFSFGSNKRKRLFYILRFVLRYGFVIAGVAIVTFAIFEPYAIIDFSTFWKQTLEQRQMTKSAYTFPYTLQYVDTTPYLYHLKNMILWGMGIPLGVLALISFCWLIFRLIIEVPKPGKESQEAKMLILVSFFITYFFIVGRFAVKFMRYFLPLYGLFMLFASLFIITLIESRKRLSIVGKVGLAVVLVSSFVWTVAFSSIYSRPHTRIAATYWALENIPSGATIAVEHWDDRVPVRGDFNFVAMPMYEPDESWVKWQKVDENLKTADFLLLASNRLYVPLTKLADCKKHPNRCYPKTAEYYRELFNGKLGFVKVADFRSFPTLSFGEWKFEIDDSKADESFTVYDHPRIFIFKKEDL